MEYLYVRVGARASAHRVRVTSLNMSRRKLRTETDEELHEHALCSYAIKMIAVAATRQLAQRLRYLLLTVLAYRRSGIQSAAGVSRNSSSGTSHWFND